eukprot:Nitzschia sp. Nitz4//scaffold159_size51929//16591//17343//NITZ4_006875-RA/size51929-processed-gene-0.40-mRNA-1//1//CDS//3329537562//4149//frame0
MNLDLADSNSPLRPDGAVVSLDEASRDSPIQTEALRRLETDAVWKRCSKCDVHRRLPRLNATSIKASEAWACEKFQQLTCDIPNDTWDDVVYHCIANSVSFLIHWDTATPTLEEDSQSKPTTTTTTKTSAANATTTKSEKSASNNSRPSRVSTPAVVPPEFAPTRRSTRGSSSAELLSLPYRYGNQDWDPIFRCWKPSTIVGKKEVAVPAKTPPPQEKVKPPSGEKAPTPEKSSPRKRAASPTKTSSAKR